MRYLFICSLIVAMAGCGPSGEELVKSAEQDIKDKNFDEAIEKIQKAADKKFPKGMLMLGSMYIAGVKIEPDHEKGFSLIRQAAELKDPEGMFALAGCYKAGLGTKIDLQKSEYWNQQAIEAGCEAAIVASAIEAYRSARGEWSARRLGNENKRYNPSDSEKRLAKKALSMFEKITDEKLQKDIWRTKGEMYLLGIGCTPSASKAEKWYKKGAEAGDEDSIHRLGIEYCSGEHLRKNYKDGIALLKRTMKKKDYQSCSALGHAYLDPEWDGFDLDKGIGCLEDAITCARYDSHSSQWESRVRDELYTLGRIYTLEEEAGTHFDKGIEYLTLSAEHYHPEACYYLAVLYYNGDGVEQDMEKVWHYTLTAKDSHDRRIKEAAERLFKIAKKLRFSSVL